MKAFRFLLCFHVLSQAIAQSPRGPHLISLFGSRLPALKKTTTTRATTKNVSKITNVSNPGTPSSSSSGGASVSVPRQLLAGGVSRAVAQMTLYPLDALRTLAQTRDGRTLADVGAKALVRGCATTSTFALVMGSIQFAVFGACKSRGISTVVASALGASASCIVSVPQDVIKQRLVTGVYTSFRQAVGTIYKTEGILGFYSAWKPAMTRNVPFVMMTFTTMEGLKRERMKRKSGDDQQKELGLVENMAIGMSSALLAGFFTQPVDVVKTRMMTQAASTAVPYSSALDCLQTIVKTEGVSTLFSGLKQRSTYMCLLWGMTFALNGHFTKTHADKAMRTDTE